jgi:FMN phosphatase YigB (HAD superfamily)
MEWMQDIKVVIFDLDGTLYQDESFVERYLNILFDGSEWEGELARIQREAAAILRNEHPLRIGFFYNPLQEHILQHDGQYATGALSWEGQEIDAHAFASLYGQKQGFVREHMYVGDAWSVVNVIAHHYRIPESKRKEAFLQVRKEMLESAKGIIAQEAVRKAIRGLRCRKVLMTNSPLETARDFIKYLGVEELFDDIRYEGNKPWGLPDYVNELVEQEKFEPAQMLSIGDHAWNDLYPVHRLGGHTVWISPYQSQDPSLWDVHLKSLDQLAELLVSLNQSA